MGASKFSFSVLFKKIFFIDFLMSMNVKSKIIFSFTVMLVTILLISGSVVFMTSKLASSSDMLFNTYMMISDNASEASKLVSKSMIKVKELDQSDHFEKTSDEYFAITEILDSKINWFSKKAGESDLKTLQIKNIKQYNNRYREVMSNLVESYNEINQLKYFMFLERENLNQLFAKKMPKLTKTKQTEMISVIMSLDTYLQIKELYSETDLSKNKAKLDASISTLKDSEIKKLIFKLFVDKTDFLEEMIGIKALLKEVDAKYQLMNLALSKIEDDYSGYVSKEISNIEKIQGYFSYIAVIIAIFAGIISVIMAMIIYSSIINPLGLFSEYINKLAKGNIPKTDLEKFNPTDEFGRLALDFGHMNDNIRVLIEDIKVNADDINESVKKSIDNFEHITEGTSQQSAYMEETSSMVGELNDSINDVARYVSQSMDLANMANMSAKRGGEALKDTIREIHEIKDISNIVGKSLKSLKSASGKINSIIEIISTIADQTNMLALNAAIEAARAGEQGRGFAVVSDQVAKLSERSSRNAKDIEDIVVHIQDEIGNVMIVVNTTLERVEKGVELADVSGKELVSIIENVTQVYDNIEGINSIAKSEVEVSKSINDAIQNIAATAEETAASAENSYAESQSVGEVAGKLMNLVERFKLDESK